MKQSYPALIRSAQRIARSQILPEIRTEAARNQLLALVDILEKLEHLADWSYDVSRRQLDLLIDGITRFSTECDGMAPPMPGSLQGRQAFGQSELNLALDKAFQHTEELSDWLQATATARDAVAQGLLDRILREALQKAITEERRLVSPPNYGSMSESSDSSHGATPQC